MKAKWKMERRWWKWVAGVALAGVVAWAWGGRGWEGGKIAGNWVRGRLMKRSVEEAVEEVCRRRPEVREMAEGTGGRLRILVFKEEGAVEVSAPGWGEARRYAMTARSGGVGPKLREGDGQIPEGFYRVESLNPNSLYHLSLRLDYPNAFDRARAKEDGRENLGGDIMIHGSDRSVGCVAIGDGPIEEVFCCAAAAGTGNVEVVIAPYDMRGGRRREPEEGVGVEWYGELCGELEKWLAGESAQAPR